MPIASKLWPQGVAVNVEWEGQGQGQQWAVGVVGGVETDTAIYSWATIKSSYNWTNVRETSNERTQRKGKGKVERSQLGQTS